MAKPLIIFDTNILMDILLKRRGDVATQLLFFAERDELELAVPEFVLFELRGTALRWIKQEQERLKGVQSALNEWKRSGALSQDAEVMSQHAKKMKSHLDALSGGVDELIKQVKSIATIHPHTQEIHFRGDLRYLQGLPPDRPVDGIKDCRIYEAILEIAHRESEHHRDKFFVTSDNDFNYPELIDELKRLGVVLQEPGRLVGYLRASRQE